MNSNKKTAHNLVFRFFVVLACLAYGSGNARATLIYEWVPCVVPVSCSAGDGGSGAFELTPTSIGATDTDFTSAIINDFFFTFDNG